MDNALRVQVEFEDEEAGDVLAALQDVGAEDVREVQQRGFTGIEIVLLGLLVITQLGNLAIKLSRLWKCGVTVDARGSTVVTQKNCDLPRGSILVISPDGTETKLHEPSELDIKPLLSALPGAGGS